jgi:SAM-dependent methyltransferase
MNNTADAKPGLLGRIRSRQAGYPTGLLGRFIGRAMVKDTAGANDRALEFLDLSESQTVLEVGYGQGRTAANLVRGGHTVIGVDVSETMVSQARSRNRAGINAGTADLRHSDGVALPFDDASADVAFTVHTIYFMPDPVQTLAEVARVLRPGGRFVIACRVGDEPLKPWMDPAVYRIPTIAEIKAMLIAAGFSSIEDHAGDDAVHWFVADLRRR